MLSFNDIFQLNRQKTTELTTCTVLVCREVSISILQKDCLYSSTEERKIPYLNLDLQWESADGTMFNTYNCDYADGINVCAF